MTFWNNKKQSIKFDFDQYKDEFLKAPNIRKVMHNIDSNVIDQMIAYVDNQSDLDKVKDPKFGAPSLHNGISLPTARNLFYRTVMSKFFDISSISHISDFGGGYGNNCRLWYSLGFEGSFSLIDLPEVLSIQKYYLENVLDLDKFDCISFYTEMSDIKNVAPNSLFFATFSLNETSLEIREKALPIIKQHDYIFIVSNKSFPADGNINNVEYFSNFKKNLREYTFFDFENKIQMKANYIIGKRK